MIINSFQKMDLDMLDILLDESRTYQDVSKETFLQKIASVFEEFKNSGDEYISPQKGYCNSTECENCGCEGYSFVGNHSRKHIDLIFDEAEFDFTDIYNCNSFTENDHIGKLSKRISFRMKIDELPGFTPDADYLIRSQKCRDAVNEIHEYKFLNKNIYSEWLVKHRSLFKSFKLPPIFYTDYNEFHSLYDHLDEVLEYATNEEMSEKAVAEFEKIDMSKESNLLKWLTQYEQMGMSLVLFSYSDIDFLHPKKNIFFRVGDGVKILASDFEKTIVFKDLFDEHYWDMLEKHRSFTEEDLEKLKVDKNSEMYENQGSLTYHLKRKGMM